jgi:type II secretory pathway component GspD/PulD (secretin)
MMSIPVLGRFFRDESDVVSRTELLITITPYVIRGRDEARGVTGEFIDRLHGLSNARRALDARRRRTLDRVHSGGDESPAAQ